jgi:predicted PurR-regulated permease PerM
MWWLLLVPILAIFMLKDGAKFGRDIIQFFERPNYKRVMTILVTELNQMLGHFMRAQLTLTVLAMAVVTLGLVAMQVPYGYALGPIAGALEFIPVIGPIIGGVIVLIVAFAASYPHPIFILIFLLIWRGIQDYFTSPRIMGGKLELHPLAVLFGILAGAEVAGVIGVFLSIPVLASIKIAWRTYHQAKRTSALDEHQPAETLASTAR